MQAIGRQPRQASGGAQQFFQALYRKPNASRKHSAHPVFPYALRNLTIQRADQVWALDITYIPMARSRARGSPAGGVCVGARHLDAKVL